LVKESMLKLLGTHLELSKKEAKTLSLVIGQQLANTNEKDTIIATLQEGVKDTEYNSIFLSVYDWSGKVVVHPDIKNVGTLAITENAYVSSVRDELTADAFYDFVRKDFTNTNDTPKVISLHPVNNSDWILASNVNLNLISVQLNNYRKQYLITFTIMGLLLVVASVLILRYLSSKYEKGFELKHEKLEDEVINLSKLNRDIIDYQQKVSNEDASTTTEDATNLTKTRILTYIRNELVPIPTEDIAYIYTENTITYVMCYNGKHTTTNVSLDELFSQLDEAHFFRANRQFIISITSIDKIVKYGNNQLKILVKPTTDNDIIISKNRASQFKKWLNT